jgi:hypothetical protein
MADVDAIWHPATCALAEDQPFGFKHVHSESCGASPDQIRSQWQGRSVLGSCEADEVLSRIPPPLQKLLFLKCPECGHRTWNCHGGENVGYVTHYLNHLVKDLVTSD